MKAYLVVLALFLAVCHAQQVRFLHAAVQTTVAVDLALNGNIVITGASYGNITNYVAVTAGLYTATIRATGSTTAVLTLPNVLLVAGNKYTIFAYGDATPQLGILIDTVTALQTAALLRISHLVEGATPVSAFLDSLPVTTFPNPIGYTLSTGYTAVTAGNNRTLSFRTSLVTTVGTSSVSLANNNAYSVFLIGSTTSTSRPLSLVFVTDSPTVIPTATPLSLPSFSLPSFSLPSFSLPGASVPASIPRSIPASIPRLFRKL